MFYFENFKPTGRLQEMCNEYPSTIHLDWPIVNILSLLCVCDTYTYTHTHAFLFCQIFDILELFADIITLHSKYFSMHLLTTKTPSSITTVQWSYSQNVTIKIILLSNIQSTFKCLHLSQQDSLYPQIQDRSESMSNVIIPSCYCPTLPFKKHALLLAIFFALL